MTNIRIAKTLAIAALSSLTLLAGASQASEWGHFQRAYAPNFPDRGDFDRPDHDRRGPGASGHSEAGYNIDARQQRQMERIMQGLRTGSLSRREARNLMWEQKEIEQLQRHYLSDRHLSRQEWLDLDRRLDMAARDIRAEKRDGDWR